MSDHDMMTALSDDEICALFGSLADAHGVALSVSGGADSMALMVLFARWRALVSLDIPTFVFAVDHQLRPEARAEAEQVVARARALGLQADVLVWDCEKPNGALQAKAREVRYRLLGAAAARHGLSHILTGHHLDDQAETLLMRLGRGSGVYGLAGMQESRRLENGCTLLRPFLGVPKARLQASLRGLGQDWIEDPSNGDPRFQRVKVRQAGDTLQAIGLTPARLADTAQRFARVADCLDQMVDVHFKERVQVRWPGVADMACSSLFVLHEELALRLLSRLIRALGGRDYPPRLAKLEAAYAALQTDDARQLTLAGVEMRCRRGRLTMWRETGREGLPDLRLAPGETGVWDGRFSLALDGDAPGPVIVRALGEAGRLAVRERMAASGLLLPHWPARLLATAPGLWENDSLCHVLVADGPVPHVTCKARLVNLPLVLW